MQQRETILLTPALAQAFLATNSDAQRPLNRPWLAKLCQRICAGQWRNDGNPIKFDAQGRLVDGQHRCHACINTGISIEVDIRRGLPEGVIDTIDTGRRRSAGDELARHGEQNTVMLAAALNFMWHYENSRFTKWSNPLYQASHQDIIATLNRHPELRDYSRNVPGGVRKVISTCLYVFCAYVFASKDGPTVQHKFFEHLGTGAGLTEGSPVLLLREALLRERQSKRKLDRLEKVALIFKAYIHFRKGSHLKNLRWRSAANNNGSGAELFPEI